MMTYSMLMKIQVTHVSCNKMSILCVNLSNISLDDTNYDEDDPETIIHVIRLACILILKKTNHLKRVK